MSLAKKIEKSHALIADLDPLHLDNYMQNLPELNDNNDIEGLSDLLDLAILRLDLVNYKEEFVAKASMRDIGFIMSSIRKQGIQPTTLNSRLEEILFELGKYSNMVLRDTVYHYSIWNPIGIRERRFTKFTDEKGLIQSVRVAIPGLEKAVIDLWEFIRSDNSNVEITEITNNIEAIINGMTVAIRQISPKIFSQELRPYFDPILVGDKEYVATGGGQVPLFLIDHILWYPQSHKDEYMLFINESSEYLPFYLKTIYNDIKEEQSVLTLLLEKFNNKISPSEKDYKLFQILERVIKIVIKFRMPHQRYAQKSFTKENIGDYDTGSGGYKMSFVEYVLHQTKMAQVQIDTIKQYYQL